MRFFTTLLFCLSLSCVFAQQTTFSRAKVMLNQQSAFGLQRIGIDLTHGQYAAGRFYINDFSKEELTKIRSLGYEVEIMIPDVQAYYVDQNKEENRSLDALECLNDVIGGDDTDYEVPENYSNGTIGGFFTYQEMLDNLDSMASKYPDLITPRIQIEDGQSIQGRPIYWLRISDNASMDEPEQEVLYTALHHAREPGSLSQLIFFMWYVLENYETNEQIKYLLDNTELYFVPCVNPDGYIFNEENNPDGGGLWRKNRRLNADSSFGVDLNRNYDFGWGFDDNGSSPNPESQVYRGTAPFSEPEVRAVRDFCNAHSFEIALNYHAFGNLLIYPWGYLDTPSEDSLAFRMIAEAMTLENAYFAGTGTETVGYTVNGVSDDWMYGETESKPFMYSLTPEVGTAGFWPPEENIIPDNKNNILQNIMASALLYNYGVATEKNGSLSDIQGDFYYDVKRYGLADGILTVSLEPVSSNIINTTAPKDYELDLGEEVEDFISYELSPDIEEGETVIFRFSVDNGDYVESTIIEKTYGTIAPDFYEDGSTLDEWESAATGQGNWASTTEDFVSAPSSITDSPNADYSPDVESFVEMQSFIPFGNAEKVTLSFWARWSIETNYDYVQLQLQLEEGGDYYPVCGKYTVEGSQFQDLEKPVYESTSDWVLEEIDLTAFAEMGEQFRLRFFLKSDQFIEGDGFYFDDLSIVVVEETISNTQTLEQSDFYFSQNRPNPASDFTTIKFNGSDQWSEDAVLEVYNALGVKIFSQNIARGTAQVELDAKGWSSGTYMYRLRVGTKVTPSKRLSVIK